MSTTPPASTLPKSFSLSLKMSWQHKLYAIIAISLIGLVSITGIGFLSINSVNESIQKREAVADYEKLSQELAYVAITLEFESSRISAESTPILLKNLELLEQLSRQIAEKAQSLNESTLLQQSDNLQRTAQKYVDWRKEWLDVISVLGFTPLEGELGNLESGLTALDGLQTLTFGMIKAPVAELKKLQLRYSTARDAKDADLIESEIKKIESNSEQFGWKGNDIGNTIDTYRQSFDNARALVEQEQVLLQKIIPAQEQINNILKEQKEFLEKTMITQVSAEAESSREAAISSMPTTAVIVSIILLLSLGYFSKQLSLQLSQMQLFMNNVAEGDLSSSLSLNDNNRDEFTQLRSASNQMTQDISKIISQVVEGNLSLLEIRQQLEKAVHQLTENSERVEKETAQSTTATQQISEAVEDVEKRASDVSDIAQKASKTTTKGEKIMSECVASMQDIYQLIENTNSEVHTLSESSGKMLGIIDAINSLADQTNLLALNAAIESARAGEAGRGFSVVADEVRALAQKTVAATANIGDIISNFNEQSSRMSHLMEKGTKLASSGQENANNAMKSFESVNKVTLQVATEMDQVVSAVKEITTNANSIAMQITHINKETDDTKKIRLLLEEHTQHLSSQTTVVSDLTGGFTLTNSKTV